MHKTQPFQERLFTIFLALPQLLHLFLYCLLFLDFFPESKSQSLLCIPVLDHDPHGLHQLAYPQHCPGKASLLLHHLAPALVQHHL